MWLERRVIAYAHQGGAWESPSSTLHAIAHAIDAGATGIELDVHATSDGELVVCHDASVDRTTDRTGSIASFTLAELREMDFSYWWIPGADVTPGRPADEYPFRGRAPADRAFGISTLREVLEAFPGVVLNLDIKQTAPVVAPYEEKLARLLAEYERVDDVIVASFLDQATDAFRGVAPRRAHLGRHDRDGRRLARRARRRAHAREPGGGLPGARAPGRSGRGGRAVRGGGACGRQGGPRVDDQRHRVDGALARPRGRRDHLGRADHVVRGAVGVATSTGRAGPAEPSEPRRGGGRFSGAVRPLSPAPAAQPRPQFGFLPWLAFFLERSLRLTVRFDIRGRA